MILSVIGFIMLITIIIVVKLFDDEIRPYHWKKFTVNLFTVIGLILIISGIIQTIFMRG